MPSGRRRVLSGHDDGIHVSNCRGLVTIERSRFHGLMDDPVNVHGTSVRIVGRPAPDRLACRFMHEQSTGLGWGHPGDRIAFLDHRSMRTVGEGRLVSFEAEDRDTFAVRFEEPVPAGIVEGDALENLTWAPDVTIRDNDFLSNRARGVLVSTPGRVVIEGNRFESSGAAILIAGDANQWYESGAVRDVRIRGNVFGPACLSSPYQFGEGIVSIFPEIPAPDPAHPFHRNIRIEDNEFHPSDYPVLYAKSVDGLTFCGNRIVCSRHHEPVHARKATLTFERCRGVAWTATASRATSWAGTSSSTARPRARPSSAPARGGSSLRGHACAALSENRRGGGQSEDPSLLVSSRRPRRFRRGGGRPAAHRLRTQAGPRPGRGRARRAASRRR